MADASLKSLEDELDKALMEMEFDESQPSLPIDLMAPDPSSTAYAAPAELLDLDFGGGAPHTDGFEAERAAERAVAPAPSPVPGSFAGQQNFGGEFGGGGGGGGGLGDRLLTARGESTGQSHGGAAKKNSVLLTVGAIGCVLGLFYAMGIGDLGGAADITDARGSCNQVECPLQADCSGSFKHKTHVWSTDAVGEAKASIALVVVGHAPSTDAVDRLLEMAEACRARKDLAIDFWVSLDNTFMHNSTHTLITELESQSALRLILGRDVRVHEFKGDGLYDRYPVLQQVPYCTNNQKKLALIPEPGAVCDAQSTTQVESILMWWKHEKVIDRFYDYVWVFDDDVGYTGNITDLIETYDGNNADLLTHDGCLRISDKLGDKGQSTFIASQHRKGAYAPLVSPLYSKHYADHYFSLEHVQRYSAALLDEMDVCSLRGITADRKEMPCTAAANAGFRFEPLSDTHVGVPFTKWDKSQLTKHSWKEKKAAWKGALFHPLLF